MKYLFMPGFGLDAEEAAYLREKLQARAKLAPASRHDFVLPERIDQSAWLAFNWQLGVFWQDRPVLLVVGTVAVVWQLVYLIMHLIGHLFGY